jgi:L-rhamnose mutarotase
MFLTDRPASDDVQWMRSPAGLSPCGEIFKESSMTRYGMVLGLKPEDEEKYKQHHAAVWPGVLDMDHTLYSYFEYVGEDYAADMAKMAADKTTQEWWAIMEPMQSPIPTRKPGEWWANMEEVFHLD